MTTRATADLFDPRNYIQKRDLASGELINDTIYAEQLLVRSHRDFHPADVSARFIMSRLMDLTGDEALVRGLMKQVRTLGHTSANVINHFIPFVDENDIATTVFGLKDRAYAFEFKETDLDPAEHESRLDCLRLTGEVQLEHALSEGNGGLRVLLTGGTGFLGQEIIAQAVTNPLIEEVVVLIRPKTIKDRKTGEVVRVISPAERGANLLSRLGITAAADRARFRFVAGDIEQKYFGIQPEELEQFTQTITHVIHCAASVDFDARYEECFLANVVGTRNALDFSMHLQWAENSPFVAHIGIETSYIHGRQTDSMARENTMVFPKNFYNNYYELTKAMGSLETERIMLNEGLRVVQLCPSIVIGDTRTGNNRGDMKVVNAPVNAFGRAHQALCDTEKSFDDRVIGWAIAQLACIFPGDSRALLNLVPVDRVAAGIIASLEKPESIGERVHLATDNFITAKQMRDICQDELGVSVRLAEPTLHRNVTLPVMTKVLTWCNQPKLATALEKLGTIFGSYSEWGQPFHEVGNDVRVLGLAANRPDTEKALRMLCRHNNYVQNFGQLRDLDELARRERVWSSFIEVVENEMGISAGGLSPETFTSILNRYLDLENFVLMTNPLQEAA
jgi:nucleoside-diphosphate-sugar epimerase